MADEQLITASQAYDITKAAGDSRVKKMGERAELVMREISGLVGATARAEKSSAEYRLSSSDFDIINAILVALRALRYRVSVSNSPLMPMVGRSTDQILLIEW